MLRRIRVNNNKQREKLFNMLAIQESKHRHINFEYQLREDDKSYFEYRKDSFEKPIFCAYCIQLRNFDKKNKQDHPVLMVGTVNSTKYVKCSNCRTIQCYDCFKWIITNHQIYIRKKCMICQYRKNQKSKKQIRLDLEAKVYENDTEIYSPGIYETKPKPRQTIIDNDEM